MTLVFGRYNARSDWLRAISKQIIVQRYIMLKYLYQSILKHLYFLSPSGRMCLNYLKAFLFFPVCIPVDVLAWKSDTISLIKLWHHYHSEILFKGLRIIYFFKKCAFLTEYVIQWWSSLVAKFYCGFESMNEQVNERIDGFRLNKFFVSLV